MTHSQTAAPEQAVSVHSIFPGQVFRLIKGIDPEPGDLVRVEIDGIKLYGRFYKTEIGAEFEQDDRIIRAGEWKILAVLRRAGRGCGVVF